MQQNLAHFENQANAPLMAREGRIPPSDVLAGHVAICVGINCRRFIVRATYLNHPIFRRLLSQAEEEYGFANCSGPLAIPCDESLFEEILRLVARGDPISRCGRNENLDVFGESRPLLFGFMG